MFKRKIYDKMLQWKNESGGNTALLVEGELHQVSYDEDEE